MVRADVDDRAVSGPYHPHPAHSFPRHFTARHLLHGSLQLCQQNLLESHNEKMDGRTDCVLCKGRDEEETKITDDILSGTVSPLFFSYRVKYPVK